MRKLLAILILLIASSCGMKMGDEALSLMSDDQLEIVKTAEKFSSKTSIDDISKAFGPTSSKGVLGINPEWKFNHGGKESVLRAYFITGGLDKIQYLSIDPMWGYVIYYNESGMRKDKKLNAKHKSEVD